MTVCQHRHNLKQCHGNQHSSGPRQHPELRSVIENGFSLAERSARASVSPAVSDSKIDQALSAEMGPIQLLYQGLGVSYPRNKLSRLGNPQEFVSGSMVLLYFILFYFNFFFFFLVFFFLAPHPRLMGVPRLGRIRAVATGLRHSHKNARSEPRL